MVILQSNDLLDYTIGSVSLDDVISIKQDQLILGWLLSSISSAMLAQLINYEMSFDVWDTLQTEFASNSHSHVLSLHQNLQNLRKLTNLFQYFYLRSILLLSPWHFWRKDAGSKPCITYTGWIGSDYEPLVQNVMMQPDQTMLMDLEVRQKRLAATMIVMSRVKCEHDQKAWKHKKLNEEFKSIPCQICTNKGHAP